MFKVYKKITNHCRAKTIYKKPKALLTGWGKISDGGSWLRFLMKVRIPIVTDKECDRYVGIFRIWIYLCIISFQVFHYSMGPQNIFSLAPNQICAGDRVNRKGPCQGDSGGPLVAPNSPVRWAAVGLVSWRTA
jgi:secreted trypsin-like serine protease